MIGKTAPSVQGTQGTKLLSIRMHRGGGGGGGGVAVCVFLICDSLSQEVTSLEHKLTSPVQSGHEFLLCFLINLEIPLNSVHVHFALLLLQRRVWT